MTERSLLVCFNEIILWNRFSDDSIGWLWYLMCFFCNYLLVIVLRTHYCVNTHYILIERRTRPSKLIFNQLFINFWCEITSQSLNAAGEMDLLCWWCSFCEIRCVYSYEVLSYLEQNCSAYKEYNRCHKNKTYVLDFNNDLLPIAKFNPFTHKIITVM